MATLNLTTVQPAALQPVTVEHLWRDASNKGELCSAPRGPLAFTSYLLGTDDAQVEISFDAHEQSAPSVVLFQGDPIPLDAVLAAYANLQALLADPRVQAAIA